jgi:uncharacterized protein
MKNIPFAFGKVVFEKEFTNREQETEMLIEQFQALNNICIISPRRWGKSSLVKYSTQKLLETNKDYKVVYLDMFNIQTEEEFYIEFAEKVLNATYSNFDNFIKKSSSFFKNLIPKLSFSPIPESEISVGLEWSDVKNNPSELLDLPQKIAISEGIKIVVCIDEFQNLQFFDNSLGFQKKLRAHWQLHSQVSYCLYGSKESMMREIFNNSSYPFYRFATILNLSKISGEKWKIFINKRFLETGKKIEPSAIDMILEYADLQPFYVQQLAQTCWLICDELCYRQTVENALEFIFNQYHSHYIQDIDGLVNSQLNLLKLILTGEFSLGKAENIKKYNLKSTANINRAKKALIDKQILRFVDKKPEFLDAIFKLWLKRVYFV